VCKFIEKLLLVLSELSVKKKKGSASFVTGFISQKPFLAHLVFYLIYLMPCLSAFVKTACAVSLVPMIKLIIKNVQLETKSSYALQLEKASV